MFGCFFKAIKTKKGLPFFVLMALKNNQFSLIYLTYNLTIEVSSVTRGGLQFSDGIDIFFRTCLGLAKCMRLFKMAAVSFANKPHYHKEVN